MTAATVTTTSPTKKAQFDVSKGDVYTCESSINALCVLLVLVSIGCSSDSSDLDSAGVSSRGSGDGGGEEDICRYLKYF